MKKQYILKLAFLMMAALVLVTGCEKEPEDNTSNRVDVTENITVNTLWLASKVYYINNLVGVLNGATLTIEPGTVIKFTASGALYVGYGENATLIANGTAVAPITFTSAAAAPTPGAWEYIYFGENTLQNTIMNYCIVEYAGASPYYGAVTVDGCKITITNSTFRSNSGSQTINVPSRTELDGFATFTGNTFIGNSNHALDIPCEYVHSVASNNAITCAAGYGVLISGNFTQAAVTLNKLTVPYYVTSNNIIFVEGNLTIAPGVEMRFGGNSHMEITEANARINASGTATERIVFTTSATSPAAGAWVGIFIDEDAATNCVLNYCDIRYAGKDTWMRGALSIRGKTVTVSNCNFSNSQQYGIYLMGTGALSGASTGNTFTACASGNTGTDA
jgi:hypothetical protein